ncbi:MAG TPA: DUF3093 domain-containing protein [Actinomycetaceae bacterium]|nr:DUF3093 domain-containing protein [Actinomycetaceae bacterium]
MFRERLRPGWFALVMAVLAGAAAGAVIWPLHATAGYIVGGLAVVLAVGGLVLTAPVLVVEAGDPELGSTARLHAGRAHIGVEHLGRAEVLDADAFRAAMGPQADPRAYVCHRPWVHTGVRVAVLDTRDPAPYWLVASRRPAELATILGQAQAAHSEQTS